MTERTQRPMEAVAAPQKQPAPARAVEKDAALKPARVMFPLYAKPEEAAVEAAFERASALMRRNDYKGAAGYLTALEPRLLQEVVERILAAAPKPPLLNLTPRDLSAALSPNAAVFTPFLLDALKNIKPFDKGAWNKPPNEDPGMYIGKDIHRAISERYAALHRGDVVAQNTSPLASILKRDYPAAKALETLTKKQLDLRPDILNITKAHLYEIKPLNRIADAVVQRELYIKTLALAGVTVTGGPQTEPGANGAVPAPGGHVLYWSPLPGVIVYRRRAGNYDPSKLPLPMTRMEEEPAEERQSQASPFKGTPALASEGLMADLERATGLTGAALLLYLVVSEGSRVLFPPRNLIPLP